MQEGLAALAGYGRIFRAQRRAVRPRPADLDHHRRLGRRRLLLAGADRLRRHDRGRAHVPHRPRRRARGAGRGRRPESSAARGCTSATASASSSPPTTSTPPPRARAARVPAAARRAPAPAPAGRRRRAATRRAGPAEARRVYDVRDVVARARRRRPHCSSSRRAGRATWSPRSRASTAAPVGIVANQPRYLGGVIDADAAQKARALRRHAATRFGLPLVVLVDTPGLHARHRQERAGVIRHGAELLHAFAAAAVPR